MSNTDDYTSRNKIKKSITSLKNKIFSFFKIKQNKNNADSIELNINIHKNTHNHSIISIEGNKNIKMESAESAESAEIAESAESADMEMIHSSYLLNDIIDKIVITTLGSCDNKIYVKNISEFYISNEEYHVYQSIFSPVLYYEFKKYVDALLTKNISILYNLRSIKLYDNDMISFSCRAGVFKTDNFIIKIDTETFNIKNEITCMYNIGKGLIKEHNIVLPYYAKITSKNKKTTNFSLQPRIHNTISLHAWLSIYKNQKINIEVYIKLCIQICKSIQFIHSKQIVHGDIKPDNILIDMTTNTPYLIDFGISGLHGLSEGTGGTKPFCHPSTTNIDHNTNINEYHWGKNEKKNDIWSISFIFACILIFRKCYSHYEDFPSDFFDDDKYININYINYIPKQYRNAFIFTLVKNDSPCSDSDSDSDSRRRDRRAHTILDIQSFILLLETGVKL